MADCASLIGPPLYAASAGLLQKASSASSKSSWAALSQGASSRSAFAHAGGEAHAVAELGIGRDSPIHQ